MKDPLLLLLVFMLAASIAMAAQPQQTPIFKELPVPSFTSPVTGARLHFSNTTTRKSSRALALGDFQALNRIVEGAVIDIPGSFQDGDLTIDGISCTDLRMGDVILEATSSTDIFMGSPELLPLVSSLDLSVEQLEFDCTADYKYAVPLVPDVTGTINIESRDSNVASNFALTSSRDQVLVTSETMACHATVTLADMDFSNSFLAGILNLVEPLIRGPVREALESTVCEEMESIGQVTLPTLLNELDDILTPYLEETTVDPLRPEQDLAAEREAAAVSGNVVDPYINFRNASQSDHEASELSHLVLNLLDQVDAWLGSPHTDDMTDLGINLALREWLLDDSGAFVWDLTATTEAIATTTAPGSKLLLRDNMIESKNGYDSEASMGLVLLDTHDELLQTTMTLNKITIRGLDSMTHFDTLQRIGNYTLQNTLGWKHVSGTADVTFRMTPSTLDDSLWAQTQPNMQVLEHVQLTLEAKDVQAVLSLFLAIHQDRLGQVPLGSLFQSDAVASCLFSTLYQAQLVSGLQVRVDDLMDPTISGFTSPGLDRVLSETMDLLYDLYEHWLIEALPNFTQTTLRQTVNDAWITYLQGLLQAGRDSYCPVKDVPSQNGMVPYVDFRDLLLSPEDARAMGGTGTEPYGDVVSDLWGMVDDQLLTVDEGDPNGRLVLNGLVLNPLTAAQSGEPGTLHFATPLVSLVLNSTKTNAYGSVMKEIASSLFGGRLELQVFNATVRNMNTLVEPTDLLTTTSTGPSLLKNKLQFGPIEGGQPLNASVSVLMAVDRSDGERSLQGRVEHVLELSVSAQSLQVVANIMAKVNARKLLNFQLQDIANPHCWLATIPAPALNEQGRIIAPANNEARIVGLHLTDFLADFQSLAMDVQCANEACSKAGLGVLSELNDIWTTSNVTTTLGERYETMAIELLTGDFADAQMARWLDEAPYKCPSNEKYNYLARSYPSVGLPSFSPLAIDTLLFTALTAAQAGLVLLSEVDATMLGMVDSTEESSTAAMAVDGSDKQYIDFTSEGGFGSFSVLISYVFNQASNFLGLAGGAGINFIVRDMLNDEGVLDIQFDSAELLNDSSLQVRLHSIQLKGLDTFSQFNILDATGPQLLQNSIALRQLKAKVELTVVSMEEGYVSNRQRVVLSFAAEDIKASVPIFAAIDADKLNGLELGSMLEIGNILSCLFTAVDEMHIPSVELSLGNLTDISVDGLLPASSDAFARSMAAIQKQFGVSIDGILDPVIKAVLNGVLSSLKQNAKCENVISSFRRRRAQYLAELPSPYLDFRDLFLSQEQALEYGGFGTSPYGDLFRTVLAFVDNLILDINPATNLSAVNGMVIAPLTKALSNESGSLVMPGTFVDVMKRIRVGGLNARVTFRASEAKIANLDTMRAPLDLLAPVMNEPSLLNSTASMGIPDRRPVEASVRLLLGLEDDDVFLRNDVRLTADLQAVSVVLTALLKIVADEFASFPLGDILNPDCWLAKMPAPPLDKYGFREQSADPTLALADLAASVSRLNLRTFCYSCTSKGLETFNTEGSQDMQTATDRVVNYITDVLGGKFLQVQIDRALNNAAKQCPHNPEYDSNFFPPKYATFESDHESSMTFLLMLLIVTGVLIAVLVLIVLCVRCFVRVRHRRLLKSLPDRQLYLLQKQQEKEDKREAELNAVTSSLFQSSASIPAYVRYLVPIVILANIAFFLSGHLSLGATVNIEVELAGQSFKIEDFFSFSMARSTIDIWNAGGKSLAALIFIFSGLWPYTKQFITLVLWFTPPARVSMARRESILLWLDTLAKWSMVDIFVLLVSIAGFRVSIVSPDLDFLPDNFYSIDLLVVPMWGLYANMIAQIISQISSHFIIHYHRRVVEHATRARRALFRKTAGLLTTEEESRNEAFLDDREASTVSSGTSSSENPEDAVRKDRLYEHAFVRPHSDNSKLVARGFVNPLLVLGALAVTSLLLAGCILPSFSLEILGIFGVFVESGNGWQQAVEEHSVFTIAEMLMDQAGFLGGAGDYLGLGTLSSLLVVTVLIVPIVQTTALLYHWFVAMHKQTRRRLEIFLETMQAWQYVEVYLIATVVASWQLGPISEFMINSYCGSLDSTFDMLVYYGVLSPGDAQCFRVEASISSAAYMLAASAVVLALLNTYIGNASRQYFRDIENKSKKETLPATAKAVLIPDDDETSGVANNTDKSSFHELAVVEYHGSSSDSQSSAQERSFSDEDDEEQNREDEPFLGDPLARPVGDEVDAWDRTEAEEKIHPVPVLFTDKFRWTLRGQEGPLSATASDTSPVVEKVDPYLDLDTDRTDGSQTLLSGDEAQALPPSPAPSSRDDSSVAEIEEDEFEDDYESSDDEDDAFVRGSGNQKEKTEAVDSRSLNSDDEKFEDEIVKIESLDDQWESDMIDNRFSDDNVSRGNTVDLSVSTSQLDSVNGVDRNSFTSRLSRYETAHEDDDSVLLGAGNVVLEPMNHHEAFDDELVTVDAEDDDRWMESDDDAASEERRLNESVRGLRSELLEADHSRRGSSRSRPARPQGNSLLQAAMMDDADL